MNSLIFGKQKVPVEDTMEDIIDTVDDGVVVSREVVDTTNDIVDTTNDIVDTTNDIVNTTSDIADSFESTADKFQRLKTIQFTKDMKAKEVEGCIEYCQECDLYKQLTYGDLSRSKYDTVYYKCRGCRITKPIKGMSPRYNLVRHNPTLDSVDEFNRSLKKEEFVFFNNRTEYETFSFVGKLVGLSVGTVLGIRTIQTIFDKFIKFQKI